MFDFISTSVPCETPYYIRANEEACQLRLVGASAAVMTEKELERAEWPAPFYIAIDHNSAAFPLEYTARLGALGVCHCNGCQEFTVFCNTMQTRGGGVGGFSQLFLTEYWQEKSVSLALCIAIHLAFTTQRSLTRAPAYLKTPRYMHIS